MAHPVRKSTAPQDAKMLSAQIDTWLKIIENTLSFYPARYKKINNRPVVYDVLSKVYPPFNHAEYKLVTHLTPEQLDMYTDENQKFMRDYLFSSSKAEAVIHKFDELLNLPLKWENETVTNLVEERKKLLLSFKEYDHVGISKTDQVLRCKYIFLLRKRSFLNFAKTKINDNLEGDDLDQWKVLVEKESDFALLLKGGDLNEVNTIVSPAPKSLRMNKVLSDYETAQKRIKDAEDEHKEELKKLKDARQSDLNNKKRALEEAERRLKEMMEKPFLINQEVEQLETARNVAYNNYTKVIPDSQDEIIRTIETHAAKMAPLQQILKHEEAALGLFSKIKLHYQQKTTNPFKKMETYAMAGAYLSEKSAGFIVRSIFENPKPNPAKFADKLAKDIITDISLSAANFILGPFGGVGTPFVKELFKTLWGVEEPGDPNQARFEDIMGEVGKVNKRLDEINDKLDSIKSALQTAHTELADFDKNLKNLLTASTLETEITKAQTTIEKIKEIYRNTFTDGHSVKTEYIHLFEELDNNFLNALTVIIKIYWDPKFNLKAKNMSNLPQPGTLGFAVREIASSGKGGIKSRFEEVVQLVEPITSGLMSMCTDYSTERDNLLKVLCVYYTMFDFPQKSDPNEQQKLFGDIQTRLRTQTGERAEYNAVNLDYLAVGNTLKAGISAGENNIKLYHLYNAAISDQRTINFANAFCIEIFHPDKTPGEAKGAPLTYNYQTGKFCESTTGYSRFHIIPREDDRQFHYLHCINDNFDQSLIPVKLGFGLGNDEHDEIFLFDRPELAGKNLRIVHLDKLAKLMDITGEKSTDFFDLMVAGKISKSLKTGDKITAKLPLPHIQLEIENTSGGIISCTLRDTTSKDSKAFELFRSYEIKRGEPVDIEFGMIGLEPQILLKKGMDYSHTVSFSGAASMVRTMGGFDYQIEIEGIGKVTADNRYLFANMPHFEKHKLQAGQKLVDNELVYKDKEYHFGIQKDGSLTLQANDQEVYWYAGVEDTTTLDRKKGVMAVMQRDGNFVFYDEKGEAVWKTASGGQPTNPLPHLIVQNNRNVVIYTGGKAIWHTETHVDETTGYCRIYAGEKLSAEAGNTYKYSGVLKGGDFKTGLCIQKDGNLVFYQCEYSGEKWKYFPKHATGTNQGDEDKKGAYIVFEPKGRLVLYNKKGNRIWTSEEAGLSPDPKAGRRSYLQIDAGYKGGFIFSNDYSGKISLRDKDGNELGHFWKYEE